MRIKVLRGLVFLLAFVAPGFVAGARAQSFLGEWTATAETPGGGVSETITAVKTENGYVITAKLVQPPPEGTPEAGPGTDIVLDGDKFSYKRSVGTLVITYAGVVSGNTFTGRAELGGFQVPYTGVRIKR